MQRYNNNSFYIIILSLILAAVGLAQETSGSVRGTVMDPSGAAIPGARVELSGSTLPQAFVITTEATGTFTFASVPAGTGYAVSVTAPGFRNARSSGLAVVLGKATTLDIRLEVGQVTESVVVSADAIMVDTQSSSSSVTVDKSFFDLIPKGRSFYDLVAIAPGARTEAKSGGIQVDGASGSENTYYLDGMEVTDIQTGILRTQNRIPVEAVQQMQVKNGVMEAQYGGAMGGVVSAVVRSGSNEFHGQAGFYFDNNTLSARPRPTLQLDPTDPDPAHMRVRYFQNELDQFQTWNPVFNFGGPLIRNKLFFFTGYMPTRTNTDRTVNFNDGSTGSFNQKFTQHYMANKIDYVPHANLRTNLSWVWNPYKNTGLLPARDGTDDPHSDWANRGNRRSGNILAGAIDYIASSKLILSLRGGYHYTNYNDMYAVPDTTAIYYSNSNQTIPGIPADVPKAGAGWVVQAVSATRYDNYARMNLNADASYLLNWGGQHSIKGGWQMNRLANDVFASTYSNGYYRYYWNLPYRCVTTQCSGQQRGEFGYYRYRDLGTYGNVSSNNMALFLQDTWKVNSRLTLNLGVRTEREYLPSFAAGNNIPSRAITFSWPAKMSPRLGFAYDPAGNGKMKFYGSWGYFYDIMKYELPRGSFGGDIWVDYFFTLDNPSLVNTLKGIPTDRTALPGRFLESINWRIPSNDPTDNTIDPNLKPMKQGMLDLGYDYSINSSLVASVRYTNRRLLRTIEDVGTLGPAGEIYYIANPGYGVVADPANWEAGVPPTPKAKRSYDAVELRLDRRFTSKYQFAASYTWSRSYGNYSGLASSDEKDGRTSPNVNRFFDLPWIGYDENGRFSEGRLATDRPHTFKFFGGYTQSSKLGTTTLSPNVMLYSGTPLTTQADVISTTPMFVYGRGDLGRTPFYRNFDLNLMHDFKPFGANENVRMRFEFTVFNLFNSAIVTDKDVALLHPDDGQIQFEHHDEPFKGFNTRQVMAQQGIRVSPLYGLADRFQGPRTARLQLSFFF